MNIIIIGPAHPLRGGIAALNERLACQLLDEGCNVEIYSFSLQYPGLLFPGKTQFTDSEPPKNLKIYKAINSINPFNWLRVGRQIKKKRPDLIIVRYWLPFMAPSTGTICRIARKNSNTKVIAITDNILPHESRPGDRQLTRFFTKSVDGFVAMSKNVFDDLDIFISNQPKRLSPHPIYDHYGEGLHKSMAKEKLSLNPNCKYLLFFGFIRDYKGLDLLLEAISHDKIKSIDNLKLIIAGEFYSNEEKYLDLIKDLGIENNVILRTDYIAEDQVNLYFCACDMITQPYKTATQSGVTQIGYHFNKPMLVTNVGGLPEIIEDQKCGYVVNPDPESISNAISDFYTNNREDFMVNEVIKAKERFSWGNFTKTIFDIYNTCNSSQKN